MIVVLADCLKLFDHKVHDVSLFILSVNVSSQILIWGMFNNYVLDSM